MSSREQFEAWPSSEYKWANDALNEAHFHGDDATGYYTGGDFIYDGRSCSYALFWAWRGWQESHQQGEVKCAALAAEKEQFAVEYAAAKIAISYLKSGRQDFSLKTPATDAFRDELRAQGVEMAVSMFVEESQHLPNETMAILRDVEGMADLIRKGEK